jgi:hypothetical protein
MKQIIMVLLILLTLTGCDMLVIDTEGVYIIDQEFITGTWYAEYEVLNAADTSYKYYTSTIIIDQVLDYDTYPGSDHLDYSYDFNVQKLLHLEIREETQSGSNATTSKGFCHDQETEYDETMRYTYTSSLTGGETWDISFTQTDSNPDSLLIQFGTSSYKAGRVKQTNKH